MTVGVVMAVVGVVLLGVTWRANFTDDPDVLAAAQHAEQELYSEWANDAEAGALVDSVNSADQRVDGEGFAVLHIPRLGDDWTAVVVEGVSDDDLLGKVGHFKRSTDPGKVGNFAIAAHRLTQGSLFRYVDTLKPGDAIVVETENRWFVYRFVKKKTIEPEDVEVLEPVPFHPGKEPTQALITLTTCHPWYSSDQRLVVVGELEEVRLKSMGRPTALTGSKTASKTVGGTDGITPEPSRTPGE